MRLSKYTLKRVSVFLVCSCFVFINFACSTIINSRKQKQSLISNYKSGKYNECSDIIKDYLKYRKGTGDELMWRLEEGSIQFEMKNFKKSLEAFDKAENIINRYDARAVINARHIGSEGGALLTNANAIPYYGFFYDRILLNTYKALNYFALSKHESAMVELRRAYESQNDAKKYFKAELKEQFKKINYSSRLKSRMPQVTDVINNRKIQSDYNRMIKYAENSGYASFINPFTTYLLAIGYLTEGNYDEACLDFRELYNIYPNSRLLQKDYVTCLVKSGRKVPYALRDVEPYNYPLDRNIVYIVFANGIAPALKQNRIQLFLPKIGYTGFAYPTVEYFNQKPVTLYTSTSDGKKYSLTKIADMDNIISNEFKRYFLKRVSRIATSLLVKEAATIAALEAAERAENPELIKLSILIGASFYKAVFNTADTRSWQLLPNEFLVSHMPIPDDGKIDIVARFSGSSQKKYSVNLDKQKGNKAIIYIRSLGNNKIDIVPCQFF